MSNIANLYSQIAKLGVQLADARAKGDTELAEHLEDEIDNLENDLDMAEEASRDGGFGWS